ncbi:MAG TPA: type II toxin-antitoxin system prevent-host-death family antitoxin [Tepidisphaeraceae bacterium]|nr:type II toxin-antitoxin system prevent-host-death family antitoxin [Tepidisphaeraceae bacterium]
MVAVRLSDAQARLPALIDAVARGEEIVITRDDLPVARLTAAAGDAAGAGRPSLRDHRPSSLGRLLIDDPVRRDELLGDMLDGRG